MAPTAASPGELRLVLNPARRKAFTLLIGSMVARMRTNIERSFDKPATLGSSPVITNSGYHDESPPALDASRQRDPGTRLDGCLPTPQMNALRRDALKHFDKWSDEVRVALRKITDSPDDRGAAQRREEWLASRNPPPPPYTVTAPSTFTPERANSAAAVEAIEKKGVSSLQILYPPIATRFTTIPKEDRVYVLSCMLLLLLSLGHYSAYSRTLLCNLTSSFALSMAVLAREEIEVSRTLMLASKTMTADAETLKRAQENQTSRRWKVGLASVAGAALIGVTGGVAAPVVCFWSFVLPSEFLYSKD